MARQALSRTHVERSTVATWDYRIAPDVRHPERKPMHGPGVALAGLAVTFRAELGRSRRVGLEIAQHRP